MRRPRDREWTRRDVLRVFAVVLLAPRPTSAGELPGDQDPGGWLSLFDGRSLGGCDLAFGQDGSVGGFGRSLRRGDGFIGSALDGSVRRHLDSGLALARSGFPGLGFLSLR